MQLLYRAHKFHLEEFAILRDAPLSNECQVIINLQIGADKDVKQIGVRIRVEYTDAEEKILVFSMVCIYAIDSKCWEDYVVDNKIIIPQKHILVLSAKSYEVIKGVLWAKTMDTGLNGVVLPEFNMVEFCKDDFVLEVIEDKSQNVS
ncbi:MAG: hypothetical protein NC035_09300 [Bacteroides sp.]|nr:hypothetical protein [Bacteroides sp.]